MSARKYRIAVVLDTNVVVANYLSKHADSPARHIFSLWRKQRKLQLIVTQAVVDEYAELLTRMRIPQRAIDTFLDRIERRETVSQILLGRRAVESRDKDDNVFLSTAQTGNAAFLITNDKDLLQISEDDKKRFRFRIVTPRQFLSAVTE